MILSTESQGVAFSPTLHTPHLSSISPAHPGAPRLTPLQMGCRLVPLPPHGIPSQADPRTTYDGNGVVGLAGAQGPRKKGSRVTFHSNIVMNTHCHNIDSFLALLSHQMSSWESFQTLLLIRGSFLPMPGWDF
jgi:hypothetical protein